MERDNSKRNVVLITVDCLRADHVGCIGGTDFTPNIDKLAAKGVVFTRAFSNGPGTNQAFPAILTSTYFLMHNGMRLNPRFTTLAEVLRSHGYHTVAFHSNPFLSSKLGWNKGFVEFYDNLNVVKSPSAAIVQAHQRKTIARIINEFSSIVGVSKSKAFVRFLKNIYYRLHRLSLPYLDAAETNKQVICWVNRSRETLAHKKVFMWIHYMDPHYPYVPPEEYLPSDFSSRNEAMRFNLSVNYNKPSAEETELMHRLYVGEVRYTDHAIEDLIEFLYSREILNEDSLLVIMADHGHAFLEHGRFGHSYDILYNEVLHIPLIMIGLGSAGSKILHPVQALDVPPTITESLSLHPPATFLGRSLYNKGEFREEIYPIYSESAVPDLINLRYDSTKMIISCILGRYKLIMNETSNTKKFELYDLLSDYRESRNIADIKPALAAELAKLIRRHLKVVRTAGIRSKEIPLAKSEF